jgi:hypothetical protein
MINLLDRAILNLAPGAEFSTNRIDGGEEQVTWHSADITQPSDAEISAEVLRLQAEYASKQYARDRAEAYPALTEQADMAYWDRQNGTTTLDDAISAIKQEFPK